MSFVCVWVWAMLLSVALPASIAAPYHRPSVVGSDDIQQQGPQVNREALTNQLLRRLAKLQRTDGSWGPLPYEGQSASAESLHNFKVSATGFALLAFMGSGHTMQRGFFADNVSQGILWLKGQQNMTSGFFSKEAGNEFLVSHAVATIAIAEACYFSKSPLQKRNLRKGVIAILNCQRPWGAWPAELKDKAPPDVLTTSWMLHALISAIDCKILVPDLAVISGMEWLGSQKGSYAESRWMFLQLLRPPPKNWKPEDPPPKLIELKKCAATIRGKPPQLTIPWQDGQLERGYFLCNARHHWKGQSWPDHHDRVLATFHSQSRHSLVQPVGARTAALQALILQAGHRYTPQYPEPIK